MQRVWRHLFGDWGCFGGCTYSTNRFHTVRH